MTKLKLIGAAAILSCVVLTSPSYAQVRVIAGDIQHIYGPGGQLLDDDKLRAQNEAVERLHIEKERMELMRRQQEIDMRQQEINAEQQ
jgi:hypothetical protein